MKTAALIYIAVIVAAIYGWVANLVDVIHAATAGAPMTTMLLVRMIGIPFAVLGAILGYM